MITFTFLYNNTYAKKYIYIHAIGMASTYIYNSLL